MVWVGLISYSAYLWHQPLFAFARIVLGEPELWVFAVLSLITLVLAQLTRTFIETPCRDPRIPSRPLITACVLIALLLISVGVLGKKQDGFIGRMPELKSIMAELKMPDRGNGYCFYGINNSKEKNNQVGAAGLNCSLGAKTSAAKPAKRGLLFGDSFAGHSEPMWDIAAKQNELGVHSVTTNWCYPSLNESFTGPLSSKSYPQCLYNRKYLKNHLKSYDFYILAGNWGDVLDQGQLSGVVELIERLALSNKPVVIMATPKQFDHNVLQSYQQSLMLGRPLITPALPQEDKISRQANLKLAALAERFTHVSFITRDQLYQVQGKPSDLTPSGVPYSVEGTHLSIHGSKSAAPSLIKTPAFKKLIERTQTALTLQAERLVVSHPLNPAINPNQSH